MFGVNIEYACLSGDACRTSDCGESAQCSMDRKMVEGTLGGKPCPNKLNGGVTKRFHQLLACQVGVRVLGEMSTNRNFGRVADQTDGEGAERNLRLRFKSHINNIGCGVRKGRRAVLACWRVGSRHVGPAVVGAVGGGTENEQRHVAGPRVDEGVDRRRTVGGAGGGSS